MRLERGSQSGRGPHIKCYKKAQRQPPRAPSTWRRPCGLCGAWLLKSRRGLCVYCYICVCFISHGAMGTSGTPGSSMVCRKDGTLRTPHTYSRIGGSLTPTDKCTHQSTNAQAKSSARPRAHDDEHDPTRGKDLHESTHACTHENKQPAGDALSLSLSLCLA